MADLFAVASFYFGKHDIPFIYIPNAVLLNAPMSGYAKTRHASKPERSAKGLETPIPLYIFEAGTMHKNKYRVDRIEMTRALEFVAWRETITFKMSGQEDSSSTCSIPFPSFQQALQDMLDQHGVNVSELKEYPTQMYWHWAYTSDRC